MTSILPLLGFFIGFFIFLLILVLIGNWWHNLPARGMRRKGKL
jgi:hypothetical protein